MVAVLSDNPNQNPFSGVQCLLFRILSSKFLVRANLAFQVINLPSGFCIVPLKQFKTLFIFFSAMLKMIVKKLECAECTSNQLRMP